MKVYNGNRSKDQVIVTVNGQPLDPRFDLWLYTFDGFEWGHGGSGPAQLALALLADYLSDDKQALALHGLFKERIIAVLSQDSWHLTGQQLEAFRLDCSTPVR